MAKWTWLFVLFLSSTVSAENAHQHYRDGLEVTALSAVTSQTTEPVSAPRIRATVRKVIDGDTLLLENGDRVRLIGINTPEVKSRYTALQPGGKEASDWLRKTLNKASIWLEYDAEQFDRYERRLAHVFLDSGQYLNALLVEQGLAMLTLIPPNLHYAERLIRAQQKAEANRKGIWQMSAYQPRHVDSFNADERYTGWQRWQVTASHLSESRKYINLVVSDSFMISIAKAQRGLFPPMQHYLNTPLEVRGWLRKQGGQHRLYVQHPSALIVLSP